MWGVVQHPTCTSPRAKITRWTNLSSRNEFAGRRDLFVRAASTRTLGETRATADVCALSLSGFRHGGNDFSRHPKAVAALVSSRLASRHRSEARHQCLGFAAGVGPGQLPDGLELVAQVAPCDGAAGPGGV